MPRAARFKIVPAQLDDLFSLAPRVRQRDIEEVWASSGHDIREILPLGFKRSERCWTGLLGKQPIMVFGIVRPSLLSTKGLVWLIGAPEVEDAGLAILKVSRRFVREMAKGFDFIENWVDARNTVSINWLRWCGFTVEEPKPYGVAQLPFHHFYYRP